MGDADIPTDIHRNNKQQLTFKSNTAVGSSGGLGSYTPSKIQLSVSSPVFQYGVSRTPVSCPPLTPPVPPPVCPAPAPALLPADIGVSWGSQASSDMLF